MNVAKISMLLLLFERITNKRSATIFYIIGYQNPTAAWTFRQQSYVTRLSFNFDNINNEHQSQLILNYSERNSVENSIFYENNNDESRRSSILFQIIRSRSGHKTPKTLNYFLNTTGTIRILLLIIINN